MSASPRPFYFLLVFSAYVIIFSMFIQHWSNNELIMKTHLEVSLWWLCPAAHTHTGLRTIHSTELSASKMETKHEKYNHSKRWCAAHSTELKRFLYRALCQSAPVPQTVLSQLRSKGVAFSTYAQKTPVEMIPTFNLFLIVLAISSDL